MTAILIFGGVGMVGQKLIARLKANPEAGDQTITVCDVVSPAIPVPDVTYVAASLTDTAQLQKLIGK